MDTLECAIYPLDMLAYAETARVKESLKFLSYLSSVVAKSFTNRMKICKISANIRSPTWTRSYLGLQCGILFDTVFAIPCPLYKEAHKGGRHVHLRRFDPSQLS
jgi:hypothetical protein